jgi:tetrahydromethanopterin S-methyltransferase subunit G
MQTMRDKWTDERLDDLNERVGRIEVEIRALRAEMNARFDEINRRIDAMNRNMLWFAGALVIAIVASNLAS